MSQFEEMTLTLDQKIQRAIDRDQLYTPTREEWTHASRYQRQNMTWPRDMIEQIRRDNYRHKDQTNERRH